MLGPLPKMSEDTYLASGQWLRDVVAHVRTAVAPRRHEWARVHRVSDGCFEWALADRAAALACRIRTSTRADVAVCFDSIICTVGYTISRRQHDGGTVAATG